MDVEFVGNGDEEDEDEDEEDDGEIDEEFIRRSSFSASFTARDGLTPSPPSPSPRAGAQVFNGRTGSLL